MFEWFWVLQCNLQAAAAEAQAAAAQTVAAVQAESAELHSKIQILEGFSSEDTPDADAAGNHYDADGAAELPLNDSAEGRPTVRSAHKRSLVVVSQLRC